MIGGQLAEAIFERGFVTAAEVKLVSFQEMAVKVNLIDDEGDSEGIWLALITERDREAYSSRSTGEEIRGVLLNHALAFFPNPTWGRVIKGTTQGVSRPVFKREDQLERLVKTHQAYVEELKGFYERGEGRETVS